MMWRGKRSGSSISATDESKTDGAAGFSPAAVVAFAVLAATALRAFLAHRYYGFLTGDDVEIAQEAFRRAIGLQYVPWDVRSLLIPDLLVAPLIKVFVLAGVDDRMVLAEVARWPFIVLAGVNIVLVYILGRRWYDEKTGAIATVLYAAHWMPSVLGSTLFPRTVAVTCILLGAILLSGEESFARSCLAGVLAAFALTARYSEAIYLVSLIVIAAPSRRRLAGLVTGFAIGVAAFLGAYDQLTWGRPFGSLIAFAELTFVRQDASSRIVAQPGWWYLANLPHWLPLTLLPLLFVRSDRRRLFAFIVVPLLALSAIYHKELRYLQVIVPFALLLAAHGFRAWPWRRWIAVALVVLAIPLGAARLGGVERRSTNAVDAARWMAARHPRVVALTQPWAYGGRIFLGNAPSIHDIPPAPDAYEIARIPRDAEYVAMFTTDLTPASEAAVSRLGFQSVCELDGRGGRAVVVYARGRENPRP
jgi:hypothetical protein